jgi:hypothetical protein
MKMKQLLFPLILTILFSVNVFSAEEDNLFISVNTSLLVFDRRAASDELASWAEENGGYFTLKSEERVRIRVPDEKVKSFRTFIGEFSEFVLEYNQSGRDLREDIMHSRSALEAREEILAKNLSYLDSSDMEGTLELEREIRRLMNEIDRYRGRLRVLENNRKMAQIDVALSFQGQSVPDTRPSSFDWINTMDFYGFMDEYLLNSNQRMGLGSSPLPIPEGFALVQKSPVFLAISPEGVRLRVRKVKNYPEQNIGFWMETLDIDLSRRGYIPVDMELPGDWGDGENFETRLWALPLGGQDYLYLTGLRLDGGKIEILEMAGEAEYLLGYLE